MTMTTLRAGARRRRTPFRQQWPLWLMVAPGVLFLFINSYVPMAGLFIAFKNVNFRLGIFGSPWCGLANFEYLFRTRDAWVITRNTLLYNLAFIVCNAVFGVLVAMLLNELASKRALKFFQTVMLMPHLISMVVVSYLVYGFLSSGYGVMNAVILPFLGLDKVDWYQSRQYWPFIIIFVHTWKLLGYNSLIYLSSIVGIDTAYYEAAEIDGASKWMQIRCITLPLLRPTVVTMSLLMVGRIFYSDFGLFYQVPMNSGTLMQVTSTIDTYVYRALVSQNNISMSSAASFYQSIVGFVTIFAVNAIVRKFNSESALF